MVKKKTNKSKKKCVLLFSGGLDSRLAVKIMQKQEYEVTAVFFKLPFGCGCCDAFGCSFSFSQMQGVKLEIFDCTKGDLLQEYLEVLKEGKHGRGASVNPCRDCKIFMFERAKKFADDKKIDLIVTGEVLGERPMSQLRKSMDLIEEQSDLKGRLLRPLSAKLLPETNAEKQGLVDRSKLYDIQGRRREKQIALANKFKIKFPSPAGGCLLCERLLKKRFEFIFKRGITENELPLTYVGRQFVINGSWIILGRDEKENGLIESVGNKGVGRLITSEDLGIIGGSVVVLDGKVSDKKIHELIRAYSKEGNLELRKKFEKYKL